VHSVAEIFESLSDEQSVKLFNTIASERVNSVEMRTKVPLTRKQYYSRISRMIRVGLIKRKGGKLFLTAFGKIVYESQKLIEAANNAQWKLKVLDSVDVSEELPKEEREKLLDNLIENSHIKEILAKNNTKNI
jgi:predicted transcriptional regulator